MYTPERQEFISVIAIQSLLHLDNWTHGLVWRGNVRLRENQPDLSITLQPTLHGGGIIGLNLEQIVDHPRLGKVIRARSDWRLTEKHTRYARGSMDIDWLQTDTPSILFPHIEPTNTAHPLVKLQIKRFSPEGRIFIDQIDLRNSPILRDGTELGFEDPEQVVTPLDDLWQAILRSHRS